MKQTAKILLVDDEPGMLRYIKTLLEVDDYKVETATTGEEALERVEKGLQPDLVLLDVLMPGIDGLQTLEQLRQLQPGVKVIMLSCVNDTRKVVHAMKLGAQDYLTKPFELGVLMARINGLLRRREWFDRDRQTAVQQEQTHATEQFIFDGKTIDFENLELRTSDQTVRLTLMEADLLRYLVEHEGRIVSRKSMLEDVWGLREDTDTRAIDNFIVRLRKYIEDEPAKPKHLLTVRGVGYRFVAESGESRIN